MKGLHGLIFAYGKHPGLGSLVERRTPTSVPFGGRYRLIDFMLSNMVNAGVTDVGVVLQGNYQSLLDHIGSGKDWDLSRKYGGLRLLPPFGASNRRGDLDFRGRMEALANLESYLENIRQDHVVLADGDILINIPLHKVYEQHVKSGADITAVCTEERSESPEDAVYFTTGEDGTITSTQFDVKNPDGKRSLEIFILSKKLLLELVDECKRTACYSFRAAVLQGMGDKLKMCAYVHQGYAARIYDVVDYYNRSMELMNPEVRRNLFCRQRPIYTKEMNVASTYIDPEGGCTNSLVADGCTIEGTVENSIIFRGVTVAKGAKVKNCILMQGTTVEANADVSHVIADKNVTITEGCTLVASAKCPMALNKGFEV